MSNIQASEVKKLRQKTGAGIMDCKQALKASDSDFNKAISWLKKKGVSTVAKKSGREAGEGLIASYIHGNGHIGVLLEVNSETDFVARNEEFKSFVKDLNLHIAAMQPLFIKEEDIDEKTRQKQKSIFEEQAKLKTQKKEVISRISEGLYKKWLEEVCLLNQTFVKQNSEGSQNVKLVLNDLIARIGENIVIRRFVRFELGETSQKNSFNFSNKAQQVKKG